MQVGQQNRKTCKTSMQVRLGKGHESPPEYRKEEDVPDFIPKEAPLDEGFVTVSRLWSVLVFILGVSIKMYGYLQKDAGADNQKFSVSLETLFLFFLFLVGSVFCKKSVLNYYAGYFFRQNTESI